MKKLLNRTLFYYSASAIILLLISAPLYYWVSEKLYLDDVDEAIMLRKHEFYTKTLKTLKENEITTWNRFNRDIQILPPTHQEKEIIIQEEFYDSLEGEKEPYRTLYSNVKIENGEYTLMIRLNLVESEDLIKTTLFLYSIILLALLSGFVIVSRVVSSRLWKPFYETLSMIENFNIEEHQLPKFTSTRTREFQKLNQALEDLIKQNLKAFQLQKEFTENASHELQTPLAVFQSKLDLLLQNPSLTHDQADIIQHLYDASSRLARVNKNLLLLAKIENKQYAGKEDFDIVQILNDVLPYFTEQAQEKKLEIKTDLSAGIQVFANKGLSEILINNLLLNAIRHNYSNGSIFIYTENNILIISNTGIQKALNTEGLFKRFSKTSASSGGSGLGLAIVEKIAELNGWKIEYEYIDHLHKFKINFYGNK